MGNLLEEQEVRLTACMQLQLHFGTRPLPGVNIVLV